MRERLRPFLEHLASFLAPGLVLLLLGIQVAFGLRGFGQPSEGPLVVLQVPGILLGWGGVVLLLPLLVWMILDWWGYDLGGFALKGLGSAVLGIAGGALFGLFEGAGGVVGNGLADVLTSTVGPVIGAIVLTIMALPAAVLALSMRKPAARPAAAGGSAANRRQDAATGDDRPSLWTRVKGFFRRERIDVQNRWYPKQRFDAWGNELPMEFDRSRDVGGIRFADEDEPASAEAAPAEDAARGGKTEPDEAPTTSPSVADLLEGEERLPTIPELLAGKGSAFAARLTEDPSGGVRELSTDSAEDGSVHVGSDGRPRAAPAPHVAGGPVEVAASASGLLPGVRYAEPSETTATKATPAPAGTPDQDADAGNQPTDDDRQKAAVDTATVDTAAAALSQAVTDAVRGPAPAPVDTHTRMAASVRESVRRSVDALRGSGDGQAPEPKSRYLEKLEASGMFEFARPRGTPEPVAEPKKAAKKKAAKKKTAKKKTAAKRPAAKKKASPRKKAAAKKAAAKKKTTTSKPKPAARKPATSKPATSKPAASKPAASKSTATKMAPSKTAAAKKAAAKKAAKKRAQARERAAAEARQRQMMIEGLRIERFDPLFGRAVEAALDRGAASSMLLTRRLGVPFARAEALLERMIDAGVLGAATESGSNPVLLTAEEWASLDE